MKSKNFQLVACVMIAAAFVIPAGVLAAGPNSHSEKQWTILIFWACDNNLEFTTEFCMQAWERSLTSNDEVNIVVFIDILTVPGTWIYEIKDGGRTVVDTWAEMNSSDPATLKTFVLYGLANYPAEKTMLLISDHGYGWRGICQDETNGDVLMPMSGIADSLKAVKAETGKPIDILAFDACNMASLEGAYELRDAATYMVASETMEPFDGLPYEMFITDMVNQPGISARDLSAKIVSEYALYYSSKWDYAHQMKYSQDFATCAAIDLAKMGAVGDVFQNFAKEFKPVIAGHMKQVNDARGYALIGTWTNMAGYEWMPDVYTFTEGLRSIAGHPALQASIDAFQTAFDQAVFAEAHSGKYHATVHGLNFWFPPSLGQYNMNGWTWAQQFIYEDSGLDLVDGNSPWVQCLMTYYAL